jgi:TonB-linked SusC/RagA family outer membrane protein
MKKLSMLLCLMVLTVGTMLAQQKVKGSLNDANGEPLIGASVVAKGTTTGTISDFDGNFELDVPEGVSTLVVTYTGYDTQEVSMDGSEMYNIIMTEGVALDEIVVTGLGIKKERKALGYGVNTISTSQIGNRVESDVSRVLRGKTTGVDITSTSGLAGSGTSIIIRGYSSITGDNQPLFVVDGVPFNTDTNSQGSDFTSGSGAASSRFLDLDPNNIAEISILKGLSATVLYGEQGRNGVVLVTTKSGDFALDEDADKGFEVSVSQGISQTSVANLPTYQNTYGNGFSGSFGWFFSNWGPSFDNLDPNFYGSSYVGEENGAVLLKHPYTTGRGFQDQYPSLTFGDYAYRPYESAENFFDDGLSSNTSINFSKRVGKGSQINAAYSYLNEEGYTPDLADGSSSNNYKKHNLSLGAATQLANGFKVDARLNFVTSERVTPPLSPGFGSGTFVGNVASLFSDVLYTPRSIDLFGLPYQSEIDGSQTYYRQTSQITHPLWTLNNTKDSEAIDRLFGSANVTYELNDNLFLSSRFSVDQYTQENTRIINKGGEQVPDGAYFTSALTNNITDILVSLNYDYDLTEDINLSGLVGGNTRKETSNINGISSSQQFVFGLAGHNNFINSDPFSFQRAENLLGLLGTATLGYKDYLYLQVMARNDWTSTLEKENRSIFYPSANLSFIVSDAIPSLANNSFLNYLKLRAGIGTSAGYPNPYQTRTILGTNTRAFLTNSGVLAQTNFVANRLGNSDLRHESHTEIEVGIEARFWQNRFGVDLSLYNKASKDLIVDLDLDPATGFSNTTLNAAEITNKGVELGLTLTPIRKAVQWDLGLNFTTNENTVDKIADGVDQVPIAGFTDLGNFAVEGEPFAVIQGSQFERVDGVPRVNGQGFYVASQGIGVIGDPNPDYTVSYLSTLSWKGLSLFINWNYTKGGDILSISAAQNLARGNTIDTEFDRFLPFILPGKFEDGTDNNIQIFAGDAFFEGFFGPREGQVFDGTVVRLREVSLSYQIPTSVLEKLPFGSASLTLIGENLWFNAINFPTGINFDPEVLSLGVGNGRGIDFVTGPTAKRIGVNLNLTF